MTIITALTEDQIKFSFYFKVYILKRAQILIADIW